MPVCSLISQTLQLLVSHLWDCTFTVISKLGTWGTNNTSAQRVLQNLGVVTACTTGFTVRFRALMAVIFSCFIEASLDGEGAGKATSNYFGPWQGERQACASMHSLYLGKLL